MGMFDRLKTWRTRSVREALPFASPFSQPPAGELSMPEFDPLALAITRDEAMTVPAVSRGRDLICGLGRRVLEVHEAGAPLTVQPDWLSRTDGEVHPVQRMWWTLDDLIFHGMAVWGIERADSHEQGLTARDGRPLGDITDATRIPPEWWEVDAATHEVRIDVAAGGGQWVTPSADAVAVIVSPADPLLIAGQRTMRGAILLETAWITAARAPSLHWKITESADAATRGRMTTKEIDKLREQLVAISRDSKAPGVVFMPNGYDVEALTGKSDTQLLVAGRNAAKVDIASFMNVPAAMEDASIANSSMTYVNAQGKVGEWANEGAQFWVSTIQARLSMDDMTGPGRTAAFDLDSLYDTNESPTNWKETA